MRSVFQPRSARLFASIAIVAATMLATQGSLRADIFEIDNIQVDVAAETAALARQQALQQAEKRAFYALMQRLALREDQDRIPELGREDIQSYVRDFSVVSEKASSVRYIATLSYRFKPEEIRQFLRAFGVPFAETKSKPVVVLPVLEVGARVLLWDEPNPWRRGWGERRSPEGLVPLYLALGDLTDITTIGAAEALAGDNAKLNAIAERYGAAQTIVAHANISIEPSTGQQIATITLLRPSNPLPIDQRSQTYTQLADESVSEMLTRLTEETVQQIEDSWKRDNVIWTEGTGVLAVTVPITGLPDWLSVKKQLGEVTIVRRAEIVLMSRDQVRVNIHYAGGPDQLTTALEQTNLSLQQESGEWIVMPIGFLPPPRT